MYKENIKVVDAWFKEHEKYGTYHAEKEYVVCSNDIESFRDFLAENFPDLCYLQCYMGTGDPCICFFREDLEKAEFY